MTEINPLDVLAIKNVVSRYCQALDSKDFEMLGEVFLPDVQANYPFNNNMKSVNEVKNAIKNRYSLDPFSGRVFCQNLTALLSLGPVRTHHSLTTQTITFRPDARTAQVETYFQGVHVSHD